MTTALQTTGTTPQPSFTELVTMGDHLVKTGFLPDHVKNGPQFAAIVMTGFELGMSPMRAVRSLRLVKGKVEESADSQLARFKASGGRAGFERLDDEGAVLRLRHPNGDEHIETWTREDSMRAGLLTPHKGGDTLHHRYPKAMMRSRVITAGLKSIGWDGAVGAYDPSEVAEFDPPPAKIVSIRDSQQQPAAAPSEEQAKKKATALIDRRGITQIRRLVAAAEDHEAVAFARDQIPKVVPGDDERSQSARYALELLCDRADCRMADVEHLTDEKARSALAWIDALEEK